MLHRPERHEPAPAGRVTRNRKWSKWSLRGRGSQARQRSRPAAPRRWAFVLSLGLITGALAAPGAMAAAARCDTAPTGSRVQDYSLTFTVPPGLMPDPQFDGLPAQIRVHRVRPVYAHGKCGNVPNRAAVLVHGRNIPGTPVFDMRQTAPDGGTLSMQRTFARAGIDTFALRHADRGDDTAGAQNGRFTVDASGVAVPSP
ncbi:hypothetical protein ACH4A8_25000 [Streptomyces vietnamensis]|uniref:hypothetical protein n=1 Tax=Streptomyces vietnamensis TaxID=362257 RepID=UPI0037BE0F2A